MASVTIEPLGVAFEVLPGEPVMTAATRAGLRWPTVCGGSGTCRTCYFETAAGAMHLSPISPAERQALDLLHPAAEPTWRSRLRLACQACVDGDVVVVKRGVRRDE